jgi:hypothetical protein
MILSEPGVVDVLLVESTVAVLGIGTGNADLMIEERGVDRGTSRRTGWRAWHRHWTLVERSLVVCRLEAGRLGRVDMRKVVI